jgi:hypothetical protein
MTEVSEIDVALAVASALDVAASLLGEPRATMDVDFAIRLRLDQVSALAAQLGPDFLVDQEVLSEAIRRGRSANVFYLPTFTKVDLFIRGAHPFDQSEFARRLLLYPQPGAPGIYVATAEDNLLRKLAWFRAGGEVSDQQWRDVLGLLRTAPSALDGEYLQRWAPPLGRGGSPGPRPAAGLSYRGAAITGSFVPGRALCLRFFGSGLSTTLPTRS